MRYILGVDYFIHFVPITPHCGGVTVPNDDGTFDVYINKNLPFNKQWKAVKHELGHIYDDHFFRDDLTDEEKEEKAEHYFDYEIEIGNDNG